MACQWAVVSIFFAVAAFGVDAMPAGGKLSPRESPSAKVVLDTVAKNVSAVQGVQEKAAVLLKPSAKVASAPVPYRKAADIATAAVGTLAPVSPKVFAAVASPVANASIAPPPPVAVWAPESDNATPTEVSLRKEFLSAVVTAARPIAITKSTVLAPTNTSANVSKAPRLPEPRSWIDIVMTQGPIVRLFYTVGFQVVMVLLLLAACAAAGSRSTAGTKPSKAKRLDDPLDYLYKARALSADPIQGFAAGFDL